MNDIMSFGIHRTWKTKLLDWMNPQLNNSLIDVASGTGDIAKKFSIRTKKTSKISCVEPNHQMYSMGKKNLQNLLVQNMLLQQSTELMLFILQLNSPK